MSLRNTASGTDGAGQMNAYDATEPLVFIHVPKTAGRSVWRVFQNWFGTGLIAHYFHEPTGSLPELPNLSTFRNQHQPVCIYGHFNRLRGFGVEHSCPEVRQFVTILRDPFEMAVSHFYYAQARNRVGPTELQAYLEKTTPYMLNHFPRPVSIENFKDIMEEFFLAIGITEALPDSLAIIGAQLGHPFDSTQLVHLNQSPRDGQVDDIQNLKDSFYERHPLEYAVYNHACHALDLKKKELLRQSGLAAVKDQTS